MNVTINSDPDLKPERIAPVSVDRLIAEHPDMHQPVIHGLLRRGETMNVIAAAKTGKSFMVGGLAWCVATGRHWLSHQVEQGRVLIIDNELHESTFANRVWNIADAMMIDPSERRLLEAVNLRGRSANVKTIGAMLNIERGKYQLIVLDALYRFLPPGTSENDNAQMTEVYNELDALAKEWDCAIAIVHHASKGQQGDKAVTDVGAGAGAIARAPDSHLIIRPHEQDGLFVLEAVTRSFKSPEPVSIKYEYPLWHAVAVDAAVRKSGQSRDDKQRKDDEEADQKLLKAIREKWGSEPQIVRRSGLGPGRVARAIGRAVDADRLEKKRIKRNGKSVVIYRAKPAFATPETDEVTEGFTNETQGKT